MMMAMLCVRAGGADHAIGIEASSPSHVFRDGTLPPSGKAADVTVSVCVGTCSGELGSWVACDVASCPVLFEQAATTTKPRANLRAVSFMAALPSERHGQ